MSVMRRRYLLLPRAAAVAGLALLAPSQPLDSAAATPAVSLRRVPHAGIQADVAAGPDGVVHMVYFSGTPAAGNLYYVRSADAGATFSAPVRVNSHADSAIAVGTIRGAQIALGPDRRIHVVWNGSDKAIPRGVPEPRTGRAGSPLLYARTNTQGTAFEAQRNLMTRSRTLDGGGSLTVAPDGSVYVGWHGNALDGGDGEDARRVWLTRSTDAGKTFGPETPVWSEPTGACGCCGMRAFAAADGAVHLLYRAATAQVNRDIYALVSRDRGRTFTGARVHEWDINACPMTSMSLAASGTDILGAWETNGQVYFSRVSPRPASGRDPFAPAGTAERRKHPRLAVGRDGSILVLWTEGTAWQRGGSLAWQLFSSEGTPIGPAGAQAGVPVWSVGAAAPRRDGGFVVFY